MRVLVLSAVAALLVALAAYVASRLHAHWDDPEWWRFPGRRP